MRHRVETVNEAEDVLDAIQGLPERGAAGLGGRQGNYQIRRGPGLLQQGASQQRAGGAQRVPGYPKPAIRVALHDHQRPL